MKGKGYNMKKTIAVLLVLVSIFNLCAAFAEEPAQESSCEWNVLIYLCGSDLESKESAASLNLAEIASATANDDVNILVETGGAREWHTQEYIGIEIANDRLQRWSYGDDGFTLVDEVEDSSMSYSQTLSDFIQWAGEHYPAKKNMLLLWDHGSGSCRGLIADENYDFAIMPLYALEKALRDGGTHFDLILTDTCLMASLEMCQTIAPYADYLAASEEVMAADGTSYGKWVPYLYNRPNCSPVQLAKRICDLTQQAYSEKDAQDTIGMFTMSVIDLSRTEAVAAAFNAFIHEVAVLTQDPEALYTYTKATHYTENYYSRDMYDLFDLSRRAVEGGVSPRTAHALQDAIEDAVIYNLRSSSHIYSHGLSVYNSLNADDKTLDHFARTCKNAEHLAYLDMCNPKWDAPEWVYEKTVKMPELNRCDFIIDPIVTYSDDGMAWLTMPTGDKAVAFVSYELMQVDGKSGVMFSLGKSGDVTFKSDEETDAVDCAAEFDGTWPTLDGMPMYADIADDTEEYILYNIPVCFGENKMQMRVKKDYSPSDAEDNAAQTSYEILGIWNEMDSHNGLPGRDVYPISEIMGEKIGLYRVVYSREQKKVVDYIQDREHKLSEKTRIIPGKLPVGDYLMRFVVEDMFGNLHYTKDFIPVKWDGKKVTYPQKQ